MYWGQTDTNTGLLKKNTQVYCSDWLVFFKVIWFIGRTKQNRPQATGYNNMSWTPCTHLKNTVMIYDLGRLRRTYTVIVWWNPFSAFSKFWSSRLGKRSRWPQKWAQSCKPLGGLGGGLSQKILKSRHSEMPFPAFSKRFFLLNGNIN